MYFPRLSNTSAVFFFPLCKVNTIPCKLNILKSDFHCFGKTCLENGGLRGGGVSLNSPGGGRWSVHLQVGIFELMEQVGCAATSCGVPTANRKNLADGRV